MICWLLSNEAWLNVILAFLSLIVTSVLTVIIIVQTSKLAKMQARQERELSKQQEELQKRQMKIDTFDYKNNIYRALYKVFQMTGEIELIYNKIDLYSKSMENLYALFKTYKDVLNIDVSETLWLFKQASYILPTNVYDSVHEISIHFNELTGDVGRFQFYPTILTSDEIEPEKRKVLNDILFRCQQINSHLNFIETMMPTILFIQNIDQ